MRKRAAGFTLLEVLVVVAVFGMLFAGLTQGSQLIAQFGGRQRVLLGSIDDLDAVDRTLRGLIEQMEPGGADRVDGTAQSIGCITRLPDATRAEIRLQLDANHRLVLRWAPHPHAEQLRQAERDTVLLGGVARIALSYQADPAQPWRSDWHDPKLPALIRIHIAFPPGDPRWWPDIVAAPTQLLSAS